MENNTLDNILKNNYILVFPNYVFEIICSLCFVSLVILGSIDIIYSNLQSENEYSIKFYLILIIMFYSLFVLILLISMILKKIKNFNLYQTMDKMLLITFILYSFLIIPFFAIMINLKGLKHITVFIGLNSLLSMLLSITLFAIIIIYLIIKCQNIKDNYLDNKKNQQEQKKDIEMESIENKSSTCDQKLEESINKVEENSGKEIILVVKDYYK